MKRDDIGVVFFSSGDPISSTIRCFEKCFLKRDIIFSHVGFLLPSYLVNTPCSTKSSHVVFESTMSGPLNDNVRNVCGNIEFGVQLRSFDELIKEYNESKRIIAVCFIKNKLLPNDYEEIIKTCVKKYEGKGYEKNIFNLLSVHTSLPFTKKTGIFCSELVCEILKDLKLVNNKCESKKISPNSLFLVSDLGHPTILTSDTSIL